MRRRVFVPLFALLALLLVLAATTATAATARTRISTRPGSGHPRTSFVLSFRNPSRTGSFAGLRRRDLVSVIGPPSRAGCVDRASITLRPARRGRLMRVSLRPGRHGGRWCVGRFHGRIVETRSALCVRTRLCPLAIVATRTIARFSFRVRGTRPAGGGGGGNGAAAPTFAGLVGVSTCSVIIPQILPREQSYTLSWAAATDPVTPSSAIVYDIYRAATSGGEDFSMPTWTTDPGATRYTGMLSPGTASYFVVRARDQAGHEDANTVERQAVNQCG